MEDEADVDADGVGGGTGVVFAEVADEDIEVEAALHPTIRTTSRNLRRVYDPKNRLSRRLAVRRKG